MTQATVIDQQVAFLFDVMGKDIDWIQLAQDAIDLNIDISKWDIDFVENISSLITKKLDYKADWYSTLIEKDEKDLTRIDKFVKMLMADKFHSKIFDFTIFNYKYHNSLSNSAKKVIKGFSAEFKSNIDVYSKTVHAIKSSENLPKILGYFVDIVNALNGLNYGGFKFSGLKQIIENREFLMNFVNLLHDEGKSNILTFLSDVDMKLLGAVKKYKFVDFQGEIDKTGKNIRGFEGFLNDLKKLHDKRAEKVQEKLKIIQADFAEITRSLKTLEKEMEDLKVYMAAVPKDTSIDEVFETIIKLADGLKRVDKERSDKLAAEKRREEAQKKRLALEEQKKKKKEEEAGKVNDEKEKANISTFKKKLAKFNFVQA